MSSSDSDSDSDEDPAAQLAGLGMHDMSSEGSIGTRREDDADEAIREATRLLQMPLLPSLPGSAASVAGMQVDGYLRQGRDTKSSQSASVTRASAESAALHPSAFGEAAASHSRGTGRQSQSAGTGTSQNGASGAGPTFHGKNPHGEDHVAGENLDDPRTSVRARAAAVANRESIRARSRSQAPTAGSKWFDMPKAEPTAEARREVSILRNRGYMDPKRHFKTTAEQRKMGMVYFQLGTVQEGVGEGKSARIRKKDRKKTILDEVAADSRIQRFADKYFKSEMIRGQRARKGGKIRLRKRARGEEGAAGGDDADAGAKPKRRDRVYNPIKRLRS